MTKSSVKSGERYGKLTIGEFVYNDKYHNKMFLCLCDCGSICIIRGSRAKSNHTKSCGCIKRNILGNFNKIHKGKTHPLHGKGGVQHHLYGKRLSEQHKNKISIGNVGKKRTDETRKNMSERMKRMCGDKHPCWQGGISFEPYCVLFNNEFKERVRNFFGRVCVECGKTEEENGHKLHVHHVNFRKDSCCNESVKPLFVTLCRSCHAKTNFNREYWEERYTTMINEQYDGQCYLSKETA